MLGGSRDIIGAPEMPALNVSLCLKQTFRSMYEEVTFVSERFWYIRYQQEVQKQN
jgi:hypothetical protein